MKEQNNELKPCPFCDGKASVRQTTPVHYDTSSQYGYGGYFVMCEECLTSGNNYGSEEKAIAAWNRRAKA